MSDVAVHVDGISKHYRIGGSKEPYGTLRDTLVSMLSSPLRAVMNRSGNQSDGFWALRDVSFDVKHGEVLGIIGRNGAGKSTLLKILSRITEPTAGYATIHGRVGSLLEVGTGFHPELTGRENIYLNGAILGITKRAIDRRFDEIVEFAEVEQFLDTPVKRYSSGMYTRLAFSVAAHLEPEILIVDEVLSVGDAEFQRKSIGKMGEVASEGRTVLFVSHNMGAVRSLCTRALLISAGSIISEGNPAKVIRSHLTIGSSDLQIGNTGADESVLAETAEITLKDVRVMNREGQYADTLDGDEAIQIGITYEIKRPLRGLRIGLALLTEYGELAFLSTDHSARENIDDPGIYRSQAILPGNLLNRRTYLVEVSFDIAGVRIILPREIYARFTVSGTGHHGSTFPEPWPGVVSPKVNWSSEIIDDRRADV